MQVGYGHGFYADVQCGIVHNATCRVEPTSLYLLCIREYIVGERV